MKLGPGPWVVGAGRGVRGVGFGPALVAVVALRHPLGAGLPPSLLVAGGVPFWGFRLLFLGALTHQRPNGVEAKDVPTFADCRAGRAASPERPLGSIPACRLLRGATTERGLPVAMPGRPRFSLGRGNLKQSGPQQREDASQPMDTRNDLLGTWSAIGIPGAASLLP